MTEYMVCELSDMTKTPYRHGYRGFDKLDAYANLKDKRDHYGKYGRKFVMQTREVTDWETEAL